MLEQWREDKWLHLCSQCILKRTWLLIPSFYKSTASNESVSFFCFLLLINRTGFNLPIQAALLLGACWERWSASIRTREQYTKPTNLSGPASEGPEFKRIYMHHRIDEIELPRTITEKHFLYFEKLLTKVLYHHLSAIVSYHAHQ